VTLADTLAEAALELEGVTRATGTTGEVTWSTDGRPFAALSADGSTAEFGLVPAVAAAAAHTPDTTPSDRGPGWVRFRPADLDDHGRDRARAWFESAYRRVARP
jgi:hypothetical protein